MTTRRAASNPYLGRFFLGKDFHHDPAARGAQKHLRHRRAQNPSSQTCTQTPRGEAPQGVRTRPSRLRRVGVPPTPTPFRIG